MRSGPGRAIGLPPKVIVPALVMLGVLSSLAFPPVAAWPLAFVAPVLLLIGLRGRMAGSTTWTCSMRQRSSSD